MPEFTLRKTALFVEEIHHDGGPVAELPRRRAAMAALVKNPFAGIHAEDLQSAMDDLKPRGLMMTDRLIEAMGGLDGIETLASGHLIGQFLSPKTNHRTDRFGGSLQNRIRFALMVHEAMREATSSDFIIGIRWVVDEGIDGALTPEESLEAARRLQETGTIPSSNATIHNCSFQCPSRRVFRYLGHHSF